MPLVLVILSAFFMSVYLVLVSGEMRRNTHCTPNLIMALTYSLAFALVLAAWLTYSHEYSAPFTDRAFLEYMAVSVAATVVAKQLHLYACSKIEISHVSVFSSLTPAATILTGWLFVKERPDTLSVAGILIIGLAIYFLFLETQGRQDFMARALGPFLKIFRSWPMACAFLSALPTALAAAFQKKSITEMDPASYALFATAALAGAMWVIEFLVSRPAAILRRVGKIPLRLFGLAGFSLGLSQLFSSMAMAYDLTANILALQRLSIVFQILLGYFFLKERTHLTRKLVASAAMLLGCALIAQGILKGRLLPPDPRLGASAPTVWNSENASISANALAWWAHEDAPLESLRQRSHSALERIERYLLNNRPLPHHRLCAVVGNSGNLLRSGYGPFIDSHEVVFRMTQAPTAGFEADVGSKTTYHMASMYVIPIGDLNPAATILFYETALHRMEAFSEALEQRVLSQGGPVKDPLFFGLSLQDFRIVHPELIYHSGSAWLEGRGSKPSTGFFTIILALQICEEVHVFGFGANKAGNWDHYYDLGKLATRKGPHDIDFEAEVRRRMHQKGYITVYPGVR
jgi:drug/metabolite transporter (DMT)-like permease